MTGKDYRRTAGGFDFDGFEIVFKDGTTTKPISGVEIDFENEKITLRGAKKTKGE